MNADLAIVLGLLGLAIAMFVLNRPRSDGVGILVLLALPLTGILTVPEALAGFSDPSVVLIAALFVLGEGLVRTGIARRLGDALVARAGGSSARLLIMLMLIVATLGSVMSSTGVVAIFIPVVLRVCTRLRVAPGQLLMPLCFAALISGMLTLVATAPNLVVHSELQREGFAGFGFFSFTPFGLPILLMGILYMLLVRRWLAAPAAEEAAGAGGPTVRELVQDYGLDGRTHRLCLNAASPLLGHSLKALRLRALHGLNVIAVERRLRFGTDLLDPADELVLQTGDRLLVDLHIEEVALQALCASLGLMPTPLAGLDAASQPRAVGLVEVLVTPGSELRGKTVLEAGFRSRHGLTVIGLRRGLAALDQDFLQERLQPGDTLLLVGPWKELRRSQLGRRDFLLLNQPADLEERPPAADRAPHALFSLGVVVVLMVTGMVPHVQAALFGCLLMVAFGCIDLDAAYRSIHWQSIVLIVGMLPFALALQRTGGVTLAAEALVRVAGGAGPVVLLASLFTATAVIGLFISNTATAVLMAPIAIATARELDLSPYPFAMIVALAASAAFMTPISSPVNTLVLGPGRYRFGDFVRVGVPFTVLVMLVSVALVSWLLPLR
jgi:di/tricarboxylate transporter